MNSEAQAVPADVPEFGQVLAELESQAGIAPSTVKRVFDAILSGNWSNERVAAFLVALRLKGESDEVIEHAALSMRQAMRRVEHQLPAVLDTCGTGGDGLHTVNVSTGAAIIASACGVTVAKHGNRGASSRCGTADVLEALGIPIDFGPAPSKLLLERAGITFLMAPVFHPAMRSVAPVRRELGVRTIFNCLGPLANPAGATHQLVGTYEDRLRSLMARALKRLGSERAWVVRGADGLDEVSPAGITYVTELSRGEIRDFTIQPEDFGLEPVPLSSLSGSTADHNAQVIVSVMRGEEHPSQAGILLNAAAALVVAKELSFKSALEAARGAIRSGAARAKLEEWQRLGSELRAASAE